MFNFTPKLNFGYFENVNSLMDYMSTAKDFDGGRKHSSKETGDMDYYGTRSWDEAMTLCTHGDEKMRAFIESQKVEVEAKELVAKVKQNFELGVVGYVPHVPNAVIGIPQNMIRSTKVLIKNKVLNVFISISASCFVTYDEMKRNAAKCAAAIDLLEREGYRCNVYSGNIAERDGKQVGYVVKIKSDREPLNLAMMAFPMANPSMLRRFGLRFMETTPIDFTWSGYGRPMDEHVQLKQLLDSQLGLKNVAIFSVSKNGGKVEDIANRFKA